MENSSIVSRGRLWWRLRLELALRTALACCMVAGATMYGPGPFRRFITYPAFSYVVTILVASDATLGEAARGCWHVGIATAQVLAPAVLSLHLIGPGRFTVELAATAVAAGALLVALPEWSHVTTKRIAFGQLVIVYVGAVVDGGRTGAVMHPLQVAASTAVGAVAAVLATVVPFPRLSYWEVLIVKPKIYVLGRLLLQVRKASKLYAVNASERLNLYVEAITAQDDSVALDSISRAKPLSETASKILL